VSVRKPLDHPQQFDHRQGVQCAVAAQVVEDLPPLTCWRVAENRPEVFSEGLITFMDIQFIITQRREGGQNALDRAASLLGGDRAPASQSRLR